MRMMMTTMMMMNEQINRAPAVFLLEQYKLFHVTCTLYIIFLFEKL